MNKLIDNVLEWVACSPIVPWLAALLMCIAFSFQLAQAGPYIEVGAGVNTNINCSYECWDNGGGTGAYLQLGYEYPLSTSVSLGMHWSHFSQYEVGTPFNDEDEDTLDHFGVKIRYSW